MNMRNELSREELFKASQTIIKLNQHPSGSYVACPLFSHYTFSWLRDGSFIAYAMDVSGETESAERFYLWVNQVLTRQQDRIQQLLDMYDRGEWIEQHQFLHTRYHLDGRDDEHSEWGHFQLDGYGAWLWGVAEHWKATGQTAIPEEYRISVGLTIRYLCAFWKRTNFDCWEERNDQLHPSTLACIYGGLKRIQAYAVHEHEELGMITEQIRQFIMEHMVHPQEQYIVKSIRPLVGQENAYEIGYEGVDASLLWLLQPFQVFSSEHPVMQKTLSKIAADLKTAGGGVRRYSSDEYYGGGEWILLSAWYGWVQAHNGRQDEAEVMLEWITRQADPWGRLPEQIRSAEADPSIFEQWVQRWGPPAIPLLWSHAMFLVLYCQLRK